MSIQAEKTLTGVTVIIPSLDPDTRLAGVVQSLKEEGFDDILLVDDGSKPENKAFFPTGDGITLLVHEVNRGKGAALKTALRYILQNRPDSRGAVTCDGDGQHLAKDARRVCEDMLQNGTYSLGVRDFSLPDVPKKSRIGNRASAAALALVSGVSLRDTQTGLRAIPPSLLAPMAEVSGDRFEYETNVLLELKNMKAAYSQVTIETVYLDENKGTHYRPFADSIRIEIHRQLTCGFCSGYRIFFAVQSPVCARHSRFDGFGARDILAYQFCSKQKHGFQKSCFAMEVGAQILCARRAGHAGLGFRRQRNLCALSARSGKLCRDAY